MHSEPPATERVSVHLVEGMHIAGTIDGFQIDIDASEDVGGTGHGPQPLALFLTSLAGCTAMDVISILRKKRQQVTGFSVEVSSTRASEHPRVYTAIEIVYRVRGRAIDPQAVARSTELSETRYCPIIAMLRPSVTIRSRYEIEADGA
jgi:putative redox protein